MCNMRTDVKIRHATSDDLDAIRALVERAYERYIERIGCRPGPMDADYPALVDAGRVDVAEADGEVAGVIVIEPHPDHVFVDNVAVAIERQGQGIGRALLEHAEDVARANGVSELRLYTNAAMTE